MIDLLADLFNKIKNNVDWIFSGIGVVILTAFYYIIKKFIKPSDRKVIESKIKYFIRQEEINIYEPRAEFDDYFTYITNQAKTQIDAISITFGFVSYVKLEKLIEDSKIVFNFYVLNPQSKYYKDRVSDIYKNSNINDNNYLFKDNIGRLKELQKKFPERIGIYSYDNYPFWHYILIDNKILYSSYHPIGRLGYKECNVFEMEKDKSPKIYEMFKSHIEIIKKESSVL